MKIETAPPEWLRAVVEAVCVALEINPAMLPTDPHLAGEKVAEVLVEARGEANGDDYNLPLGITQTDMPPAVTPKQRESLDALRSRLEAASYDARRAADAAEEAANIIDDEIMAINKALKNKETPK